MNITPFEQFRRLAREGNIVPVSTELLADLETPVSIFRKVDAVAEHAFLLESVEGGERLARYSFIGFDPAVIFRARGAEQHIDSRHGAIVPQATPVDTIRALLARYRPASAPGLPPFTGGGVGYLSYDSVRYFERIPNANPDVLGLPDCFLMIAENVIAFDHVRHRLILVANARVAEGDSAEASYARAVETLMRLRGVVRGPAPAIAPRSGAPAREFSSNFQREEFAAAVLKAKEYIAAGDIFQVVLSQRFSAPFSCPAFDVYRALRAVNPSPYMFYLKCGSEFQLAGSSPEILAKLERGTLTVRPIAGTRHRGATPGEDAALEAELLADAKERAEHVMLVDLGRNDVGRVCDFGTVTVSEFMAIERYSHVMHIVSNVEGRLAAGRDAIDSLGACFPAGTLTGAPKIRAMEVIDELENLRRGPYGGAVVYLGFNGNMDSAITIRTILLHNGTAHIQAGAGVVADSDPRAEFQETVNKAKGMMHAVELAEEGLE